MTENMIALRAALLRQKVSDFKASFKPKYRKNNRGFVYDWAEGNGYSMAEIGEVMA